MPEKARLVVSTLEGDCLDVLRRREAEEIPLPPLGVDEQRQIVDILIHEWKGKEAKLDEAQMAALLAHPGVKNPLYLRVAMEELKLLGNFGEDLKAQIEEFADDIPGIFGQVLERLEEDHGDVLVAEVFSLIGCSRYGLSETELLQLLRREREDQFPRVLWARLYRISKIYLVQRGDLIGLFHRQLSEAAATRYPDHKKIHTKLAAYFAEAPIERKLDEYPYQLQHASEWETMAKALSDLDFFKYAWEHDRKYEWMGYWRSLEGRFEPGDIYQEAIEAREESEGETGTIAWLSGSIGWFLGDMGLYNSALPFKERALAGYEKALGPNHPTMAENLNNLADLYRAQGKYDQALPLHLRALEISEKVQGPNHPDTATFLSNLVTLYTAQGKYDEALSLCRRALAIDEKALGPNHLHVANILNNLAELYRSQGKYAKALPLYRRALAIDEKALGPNHPAVARDLNNLALLYAAQRKYNAALPLYSRALAIDEKTLGPNHPEVATHLYNLAELYRVQWKYDEALPLFRRALAVGEKTLGPDHPNVATFLSNLATLYYSQGKYDEALPLCRRAVLIAKNALGLSHPHTKIYETNLKKCEKAMRKR
jgi:tetratricopeptide (TPR) repeat protein